LTSLPGIGLRTPW